MLPRPLLASLTRISDLNSVPFDVRPLENDQWETGDYVVGEVVSRGNAASLIELCDGRMIEVMAGDRVAGAFGVRTATLEAVGHWREIGINGAMQALTAAGLFGRATSVSTFMSPLVELAYSGHIVRHDRKVRMRDFVPQVAAVAYDRPTIILIGTSMSSGKTTAAKVIIRQLVRAGVRVAGVKLTGAGRYRDTLAMRDAGAAVIFDFVDAGLPSTACPEAEYRSALATLLSMINTARPDVVVAEAGASPLEPYNGDVLIEVIREQISCTVLCASDPYAVVGVTQGFGFQPDLVAGLATSTSAGMEVVNKLTGLPVLNLTDPQSLDELNKILQQKLDFLA